MTTLRTTAIFAAAVLLSPALVFAASSASSEVYTNIQSSNGSGTQTIDIETSADGEMHTQHIERSIPAGTSEIYVATSSGDGAASAEVYTRVGESRTTVTDIGSSSTKVVQASTSSTEAASSSVASTSVFEHPKFSAPFFRPFGNFVVTLPHSIGSIFSYLFSWLVR